MKPFINAYKFGSFEIRMMEKDGAGGISRAGQSIANIIPHLENCFVLDLGCGAGYMTIGALISSATHVVAVDIDDVANILLKNICLNGLDKKKITFIKSDLFSELDDVNKFDAVIANLPQHALPATPSAKKLLGKYGGFDGTDLICKALTEGAYYLKPKGRFYTTISRLTNFRRTLALANCLYNVQIHATLTKTLEPKEMEPYVKDSVLLKHLALLKVAGLIEYNGDSINEPVTYLTNICEFIKER